MLALSARATATRAWAISPARRSAAWLAWLRALSMSLNAPTWTPQSPVCAMVLFAFALVVFVLAALDGALDTALDTGLGSGLAAAASGTEAATGIDARAGAEALGWSIRLRSGSGPDEERRESEMIGAADSKRTGAVADWRLASVGVAGRTTVSTRDGRTAVDGT